MRTLRPYAVRIRHVATLLAAVSFVAGPQQPGTALFKHEEVMVPVRDGAHLQTVILWPANQTGPLPILLRRTPYGVPSASPTSMPPALKELMADGYILVV